MGSRSTDLARSTFILIFVGITAMRRLAIGRATRLLAKLTLSRSPAREDFPSRAAKPWEGRWRSPQERCHRFRVGLRSALVSL